MFSLALVDSTTFATSVAIAAPTVDEFEISFGDVVRDGVPTAGAGNIEVAEAVDSYTFDTDGRADTGFSGSDEICTPMGHAIKGGTT